MPSFYNILGVDLTTNIYDYITPLGQKLQYFSNEICRICPFISSKYKIDEKTESMECYNPTLLDDAYKNLEELMLIHADYWGNFNALNCNDLLAEWKSFKKHINDKYYEKLNILAIIKIDILESNTCCDPVTINHDWDIINDTLSLSSDRFTYLSIDLNDHIKRYIQSIHISFLFS